MMANPHVPHRGRHITLVRDRLQARLHLPARRGRPRLPPPAARGRGGLRRRPPRRRRARHRRQPAHHRARRRRRLHLRRGDRAPRQPRGPPRPAAQQAAVPRRRGPVRPARPSVNNVESIASVPGIILEGVDWFTGMGTEKSTGFGIFSLSGHVKNPGQYEAPLGITMRELLDMAGGMRDPDKALKFWTPGGSSTPLFTDQHLDVPLDFESVGAAGSMLGTRALQIFDETVCVVRAVDRWTDFYKHESCGKCTPCREGTWWLKQILGRLEQGEGSEDDLDKLLDICDNILGRSFCALGDGATSPITSSHPVLPRRVHRAPHARRLPVRPEGVDAVRQGRQGQRARMTMTPEKTSPAAPPAADLVTLTIDDREVSVAQGHPDHPGRRRGRHRDPAVLRPPAARPGRRVPPVPRRGVDAGSPRPRRHAGRADPDAGSSRPDEAAGLVHDDGGRRAWSSRRSTRPRVPTRRSRASWSCCSSTTRSTARSATRAASAPCRTRR